MSTTPAGLTALANMLLRNKQPLAPAPTLQPGDAVTLVTLAHSLTARCVLSLTPADAAVHRRLAATLTRALERPGLHELALFTVHGRPEHEHLALLRDRHGWTDLDGAAHLLFSDEPEPAAVTRRTR